MLCDCRLRALPLFLQTDMCASMQRGHFMLGKEVSGYEGAEAVGSKSAGKRASQGWRAI